ncbi:hypothetical protein HG530_012594 [Fusarium avenaceum]|nr:hypothetical protein HG530_012594 [Fusarium avenaceum]
MLDRRHIRMSHRLVVARPKSSKHKPNNPPIEVEDHRTRVARLSEELAVYNVFLLEHILCRQDVAEMSVIEQIDVGLELMKYATSGTASRSQLVYCFAAVRMAKPDALGLRLFSIWQLVRTDSSFIDLDEGPVKSAILLGLLAKTRRCVNLAKKMFLAVKEAQLLLHICSLRSLFVLQCIHQSSLGLIVHVALNDLLLSAALVFDSLFRGPDCVVVLCSCQPKFVSSAKIAAGQWWEWGYLPLVFSGSKAI